MVPRHTLTLARASAWAAIGLLAACASGARAKPVAWDALGPPQDLGAGITPGIAIDPRGGIHVVCMAGKSIQYRMAGPDGAFGPAEEIPAPEGPGNYNSPHVVADAGGNPHVVFEKGWAPDSLKGWYTNRIGGRWKEPIDAFDIPIPNPKGDPLRVNYPRLALAGPYAFAGALTGNPAGRVVRLSGLDAEPRVDKRVDTTLMNSYPVVVDAARVFVLGRNGPAGHFIQEYDLDLERVGKARKLSTGTRHKTGEPTAAAVDRRGVVHAAGNAGATGVDPETQGEMWYTTTARLDAGRPCIRGLTAAPGTEWWGEDVYVHMAIDDADTVYLSYRDKVTGEGKVTRIVDEQFAPPATFAPRIPKYLRWNAQIAPAPGGGVYVAWDDGKTVCVRAVGVARP